MILMNKLLDLMKKNKKVSTCLLVTILVFGVVITLIVNRGTYSNDENVDSLIIDCPDTVLPGSELECSIILNSVTMSSQGIMAKYKVTEGLEFVELITENFEANTNDEDGFVLVNLYFAIIP